MRNTSWRPAWLAPLIGAVSFALALTPAASAGRSVSGLLLRSVPVALALTSQTITFGALAGKTYGAAPFTISATASSGLTVSFASLTTAVCTVSGNTVTIVAAGTCTIQASQAGDATFAAAPNVNQSFAVAKAAQTITFGALTGKTYGAAPFTVSATASSGLVVSFTSTTTAVCTVSTATVTIVAAGTCTIRASQAGNANYNAAPNVNQSFAVAKAAQTITFGALAGKTYGAAPFTVSATASSGLTVAFTSTTTAVCTVSTATVTIVAAGTCTIRASQAGNGNYNAATNVNQSFTVAKAAQTITFSNPGSKTLGTAPFLVSATASSGLVVTISSLTTTICTISSNNVTLLASGTCTLRAAQSGNANYLAATNVDQSFTVSKASQTITFGALANKAVGDPGFSITATASSGLVVTFTSLTTLVCGVSGNFVSVWTVGTCTIRASQIGNATYAAAPNVSQSFAVAKGSQTIIFGALSDRDLGSPPFSVSADATSGLPVSVVSTTTAVCDISEWIVTTFAIGTCTIQASQGGDSNYLPAPVVNQSFFVVGNQTIAFSQMADQALTAGPIPLNATASSGLTVNFASLTTSVCSVAGASVTPLAVGVCTIRASQSGSAFYHAAPSVDQSFNILLTQTITFNALQNLPLGTPPFVVLATASSGLPVAFSSLTGGVCTVTANVVTLLAQGPCTIRASQSGNATYLAAPNVDRGFTVIAPPTIQYFYDGSGNVTKILRN